MDKYTLDIAMKKGRSLNLNFLRFLAALLVIVSHAYPLSLGADQADFFSRFSNGGLGLGGVAVAVFFLSSGLLVSKSVERKNTFMSYFKARSIRIFPPLFFVVLLSMILGAILTSLPLMNYLTNSDVYKYLLNALLIPIHQLPGVFESNVYGSVVNGALWTLPVEFLCYIALFIAFKIKVLNKKNIKIISLLVFVSFCVCFYSNLPIMKSINIYLLPVFIFYIGMCYYIFRDKVILNKRIALLFIPLWLLFIYLGFAEIAMCTFFPYMVLVFIYSDKQCSKKLSNLGEYSYGIYLCGFPIQQLIVYLYDGEMSVLCNILISIPLACFVGMIIFRLIEKPLLNRSY